eukprot:GEMP01003739.1.p1 GENE.GEMP01003739.1~~GEMP01003739.1.p1  ORF type:complete len:1316 (+),score=308.77 GEMP01003739.1:210-4157(+)
MHDKHRHPTYRYPDAFDSKTNTGRWIYQELIGEGGFGLVWRVKDAKTTVRVALKLLKTRRSRDVLLATQEVRHTKRFENLTYPPTGHTLFTKYLEDCTGFELYKDEHALLAWAEGSLWNRLSSRDVIRPKPYIVMELIYGNSVSNLLIHDTLTVEDRVHIMHQSVVALDYLWRHRCVHRDFRVHNVMWRKRQLKVVDFGLCLHHANPIYATSSNPLFRTYWREDSYWIPPEVKHKDPVCNFYKEAPASFDVYGLGVLALELILEAEVSQFLTKSQKHIEDRNIERLLPHQALSLKYITKQQVKDLALEWSFFQRLVSPRPEERPSAKAVLQFMNKRLPDGFGAPPQYPADAQNWAPQVCDAPQESTNTHPPSVAQKSSTVSRGAASRESTKTHPPSVAQKSSTAPLVKSRGSIPHYPDALASETFSVAVSKYCTRTKNVSSVPLVGPIDGTQHGTIARKAALPVLLAKSRDSITQHPTGAQNISPVPIAATRSSTLHPTGPQIFSPVPEAATTSGSTQYPTGVQKYSPVPFAESGSSNQHPVAAQKCSSVPLAESSSSSKHPTDAPTSAASLAESSGSTHDPTGAQELPVASLATSSSSTQLPTEAQTFSTAPFATPSNCAEHPPATRTFSAVPPTKSSGSTQNPTGAQTSPNASTQHPAGPVQTFSTAPVSDYTKHPPGTQKLSGVSLAASTDSSLRAFETQLSEYVDTHRVGSMFTMTTLVQHFIRDVHLRAQYVQSMLKLSDTGSPNVFRLLCMIDSTILASRTMVLDAGSRNVHQDFAPAMKRFLDHAAKLYSDDSPLSNKIRERIQRFIDTWCAHNVFTLQELGGTSATDPSVVESVNHRHDQGPENAMPDCGGGQERPLTPEKLPIVDEGASELPSTSPSLREVASIRRPRTRRNWARSRSRSDGRRRGASELPPDDYLGSSRSPSFPSRSPLRSNGSPSRRAPSRTPSVRSPIVTPSRYEGGASLRSNGSPPRHVPSRSPSVRLSRTSSRYEGGASLRSDGLPSRRAPSRPPPARLPRAPSRYRGSASLRRARYTTSGRRKRTSRSRDALSRVPQFVSPSVSPVVTNSDASTFSRCVPPYTILLNSEHTLVRVSEGSSCSNGTAATGSRLQASNTRDAHSCLRSRSRSRSEASSRCSSVSLCETCGERLYSSGSRWSSSCGSPGRCIQSCCRDPYGSPGQKSPPRASGEDTVAVHASAHRPVIGDSRASASRRRGREELPLESPICSDTELHSTQKKTRLVGQTRRLSISPSPVSEHASVISSVCGIHDQFPVAMMDDCFPLPTLSATRHRVSDFPRPHSAVCHFLFD